MSHIFDSTEESYTIRHLTDRVRSVNVERTFCPLNIRYIFTLSVMPQSHTHLRTLTESFGSNRSRPQKKEGGA